MTWPVLDQTLLADAASTFNFKLGLPIALAITPDGAVLFRKTPARDFAADLYELSATGTVRTLATTASLLTGQEHLSDAEKARRERSRTVTRGIVDIDVSDDGRTVFVPLGDTFHLIDRATGARTAVDPGGPAYDPHLSPNGSRIAFIRDGDLWIVSPTEAARRITHHEPGLEYGVADFAAQEELGRRRGFWWSPDSTSIVFQRTDARAVDTIYVADARHPERVPVPFKYPRAGTPNATIDLGVISLAGGDPRWLAWDPKYSYLVDVVWPKHGPLTAVVLDREQTNAQVVVFEPDQPSRVIVSEHDDAWLNVNVGAPMWLDDGSAFLWMTESRGAWTLELRDPDGALRTVLTLEEFHLRSLVGVEAGAAIVHASPMASNRQDVYRVPFNDAYPMRLCDGDGVSSASLVGHGVIVIDTLLQAGGRRSVARRSDRSYVLPSNAEQPSLVPTTVLETVEIEDRIHHVAITRPRSFDPQRRYPVLVKVYAGPHFVMVEDARDAYVMDQYYADAGFIVIRSDGRGTPNRGRAWERAIANDLITVPLADQIGALQAIGARHHELDLDRVGITGWSFGGYVSAMAVLLRPDVFKAAVAGAPVTDWSLYDTAYTERYMRTPATNPDGYRSTSALTHAAKLSRPLLVIHGITDDNVHFAHTLALIEALYLHAKRAEVITLSATHMVPDPRLNQAREQVQIDFFRQHLGPPDTVRP